jgi:LytS/YehU family sensor histidine kinase
VLLPVSILRKRYLPGLLLLLFLLVGYTIADTYAEIQLIQGCPGCVLSLKQYNPDYFSYLHRGFINVVLTRMISLGTPLLLLFALSIPFSIKMTLQSFRSRLQALELVKDNLQLELNFLKAQLNPHFLFNSMNNIYGLIMKDDKDTAAALVARLSELLRYTLYDADQATMPAEKEVALIQDYVALEKVRLNDTKVTFNYQIDDNTLQLAPLLMIPLTENAFKYCGDQPDSFIDIVLNIVHGQLQCVITNSIDRDRLPGNNGGIGLPNFRKRMDLYYAGKYQYEAGISNNIYSVHLTIRLL